MDGLENKNQLDIPTRRGNFLGRDKVAVRSSSSIGSGRLTMSASARSVSSISWGQQNVV